MEEIYHHALKLLRRKDYTQHQLSEKLKAKFGAIPDEVTFQLRKKRFIDDRRYAENFVERHPDSHPNWVRSALAAAGIDEQTINGAVDSADWPSLPGVVRAKMQSLHLCPPLQRRDVARLYRILSRLGYPEDEIREELEQLYEQ